MIRPLSVLLTAVAVVFTTGTTQAAYLNGTFAGTFGSSTIALPAGELEVQNATQINVALPFVINSGIPPTFNGNPNDLSSNNNVFPSQNVGFTPVNITIQTNTADSSTLVIEFGEIAPGVYRFVYTSDTVTAITRASIGLGSLLSIATSGTVVDTFPAGSTGSQFANTPAGLSLQFIQQTSGAAVSGSFSFSTSEVVPEPASLALAGVAAAGFGVRRLRRRTAE